MRKPYIGMTVIYHHPGSADGKFPPMVSPALLQDVVIGEDGTMTADIVVFSKANGLFFNKNVSFGNGPSQWSYTVGDMCDCPCKNAPFIPNLNEPLPFPPFPSNPGPFIVPATQPSTAPLVPPVTCVTGDDPNAPCNTCEAPTATEVPPTSPTL